MLWEKEVAAAFLWRHKNSDDVTRMEQRTLKIVNNYLNTSIYSYLDTSGGLKM